MGRESAPGEDFVNWAEGVDTDTEPVPAERVDYTAVRPLKSGPVLRAEAPVDYVKGSVKPAELAAAAKWKMSVRDRELAKTLASLKGSDLVAAWKAAVGNSEGNVAA